MNYFICNCVCVCVNHVLSTMLKNASSAVKITVGMYTFLTLMHFNSVAAFITAFKNRYHHNLTVEMMSVCQSDTHGYTL